jgi:hypothetical protein
MHVETYMDLLTASPIPSRTLRTRRPAKPLAYTNDREAIPQKPRDRKKLIQLVLSSGVGNEKKIGLTIDSLQYGAAIL